MSDSKYEDDCEAEARAAEARRAQKDAPRVAYAQDALVWRPFEPGSLPPENDVILVRYLPERFETGVTEVSRMGSTVKKHRVYSALTIYTRAPYSKHVHVFRGLVVLEPRRMGAADAAKYMDGEVVDAFDAWMPCPT